MFTWNFQFVSKARLRELFKQLMLDPEKGDILVRIHTAIHGEKEAADLAKFIKDMIPGAHILGTSTSAIIQNGKVIRDQCLISITQMNGGRIKTTCLNTIADDGTVVPPCDLCENIRETVIDGDTGQLLTFLTARYPLVGALAEESNRCFPGIAMMGGIAAYPDIDRNGSTGTGFVFDENGASDHSMIAVSFSGEKLESCNCCVAGADAVVDEAVDAEELPLLLLGDDGALRTKRKFTEGKNFRPAIIYARRIIADNRRMYERIENFEKAETLFCYTCASRFAFYPNCVNWELSAYSNSNLSGCVTDGELTQIDGNNVFANCCMVITVLGEAPALPMYNPYVFLHTEALEADDKRILGYLTKLEKKYRDGQDGTESKMPEPLRTLVDACEHRLFRSGDDRFPGEAAMNMDIGVRGYDRVCIIHVLDTAGIQSVFPEDKLQATYKNLVEKLSSFAEKKKYLPYTLGKWEVALAAPSYMVSLKQFIGDMYQLQAELFQVKEELIAIIPVFCILNECTVDNLLTAYSVASLEMLRKNIQFYVYNAEADNLDEESIREKYHIVNVINYALTHDKVIPYFQGIYDNRIKRISHYESLMRLEDENGRIYTPDKFLGVARNYGLLYDSLSMSMVKKVLQIFKDAGDRSISINLGMRDITNEKLVEYILDFLSMCEHPENLIFEILENEDVDDYEAMVRFVDNVHRLGGKISIDDFGSGYSNLQHIAKIHSDFIKIDGSIIRNCCNDPESERLVVMIASWKNLSTRSVDIVAEYVENREIQELLEKHGIDYSQGYLFSKPSPHIS